MLKTYGLHCPGEAGTLGKVICEKMASVQEVSAALCGGLEWQRQLALAGWLQS